MPKPRYLNDAWLYWDPEHLQEFPHSSTADPQTPDRFPRDTGKRSRPLQLRLLEDVLLYAAGVASAVAGIGLVILLGSFVSAYSVLTDIQRVDQDSIAGFPAARHPGPVGTPADKTTAREGVLVGGLAGEAGRLTLLETRIHVREGAPEPKSAP